MFGFGVMYLIGSWWCQRLPAWSTSLDNPVGKEIPTAQDKLPSEIHTDHNMALSSRRGFPLTSKVVILPTLLGNG